MAFSEYRIFFDGQAADDVRVSMIDEIRVDLAIDMVAEAQITIPIGRDEDGEWPDTLENEYEPLTRVRIEVSIDGADFVPLIEGRIVAQRFELGGGPNESRAVLVVHDESALMNREDKARAFEDMPPEDIAAQVFDEYGFSVDTQPSGIGAPSLERVVIQRGTDFSLLRRLARQANMMLVIEPGSAPGETVGGFRHINLAGSDVPEMILSGAERNVNRLTLEFDALSPVKARSDQVDHATLSTLSAQSAEAETDALGETRVSGLAHPAQILIDPPAADTTAIQASVQSAVDRGAWAYSGDGEVSAEIYTGVLRPYQVLSVAGAGSRLSGSYLISEVTHTLRDDGYRQAFTLRRNARSDVSGPSIPGGIG